MSGPCSRAKKHGVYQGQTRVDSGAGARRGRASGNPPDVHREKFPVRAPARRRGRPHAGDRAHGPLAPDLPRLPCAIMLPSDAAGLRLRGWQIDVSVNRSDLRRLGLLAAMATALGAIAAVAYWDAARESEAALQDFAEEQATLAGAIGVALGARSAAAGDAAGGADHLAPDRLLLALRTLERPASLALLLRHADEGWLRTTGGLRVLSPRLIAALDAGESVVRIPRAGFRRPPTRCAPRTAGW